MDKRDKKRLVEERRHVRRKMPKPTKRMQSNKIRKRRKDKEKLRNYIMENFL